MVGVRLCCGLVSSLVWVCVCACVFSFACHVRVNQSHHAQAVHNGSGAHVPNDVHLSQTGCRCLVVTGPNMGGKSTSIRMMACLVILAHMGCSVPARAMRCGVFDAVYTRMGASDNISQGMSTFLVELSEAATILNQATARSLVILDELGRGTSTHDGVAIADAALEHLLTQTQCFTLFITHYPSIGTLAERYPGALQNFHMAYLEKPRAQQDDAPSITFLYRLTPGMCDRSFGLNVARMADLPVCAYRLFPPCV
jgi:DNA mismatch repair protein MSH3